MIRWTVLAPWVFEFHFPGSLTSTFLVPEAHSSIAAGAAPEVLGVPLPPERACGPTQGTGAPRAQETCPN